MVYNSAICIGCRYCLIACPFQIPAYEYRDPLTPRVRKCEFCADWRRGRGADPACAAACPTEAIVFGRRADLLRLARQKIEQKPKRYTPWIYGEREAGGTSWLYLNGRPAAELDLLPLPSVSPARQTEAIQHGVYRFGVIPLLFYGFLGGWMWLSRRRRSTEEPGNGGDAESSG